MKLTIDNRPVEVPPGTTILSAAAAAGIHIPTLCFLKDFPPSASCMVCLVKVRGKLVPACATVAEEGMAVESQTAEVLAARKASVELLLSDHLGDCVAPCTAACPAHMDIPRMIRQIAAGDVAGAIATVRANIPLPATLGRICPAPCEKACRRSQHDGPVGICLLKRFAADAELGLVSAAGVSPASFHPSPLEGEGRVRGTKTERPDIASSPSSSPSPLPLSPQGRGVAIVGAGPAGLSAAYYLALAGHACTILDANDAPGGALRKIDPKLLPPEVLSADMAPILAMVQFRPNTRLGRDMSLDDLRRDFGAVVLTVGHVEPAELAEVLAVAQPPSAVQNSTAAEAPRTAEGGCATSPLKFSDAGIAVDRHTHQTGVPGVFAGGEAIRKAAKMVVRSVGDAHAIAVAVDQFLTGKPVTGQPRRYTCHVGHVHEGEMPALMAADSGISRLPIADCQLPIESQPISQAGRTPTPQDHAGYSLDQARAEAMRCLHCDCRKPDNCRLRDAATELSAGPNYRGERRTFSQLSAPEVLYEPGKCILCGLCIQIARREGEGLGLAFVGRGFDVRVGVPFNESLAKGLSRCARKCEEACPTGAISLRP